MPRINFAKQSYQARSKPLNSQRCVNMYLEPAPEDSKAPDVLYGVSGLTMWAEVGTGAGYGMHVLGDYLYAVSGNNVYRISQDTSSVDLGTIGTTTSNVVWSDNGIDAILVKQGGAAYLADSSSLTQITDPDFEPASTVTVLDGYAIFSRIDSNQYAWSAIQDASSYNALDFASAEESPDNIVALFAIRGELWIFGEKTTEVHYNSGNSDRPFIPIDGATMRRGCAAKRSVVQEDNTLFWLGDDRIVYRADGYRPQRISQFAIEDIFQKMSVVSDAEGFSFTEAGHKFYVLTFPTELQTWVYDISTGLWHQRQSFEKGRWRATGYVDFAGKKLVQDFESGNIYEIDQSVFMENGEIIQGIATAPPSTEENYRLIFDELQVDFDNGVGLITGQGQDPQVMLRFSDDGGYTWSNENWRSIGKIGKYKNRAVWRRMGQSRERVFEITITDPVRRAIKGAFAKVRLCRE